MTAHDLKIEKSCAVIDRAYSRREAESQTRLYLRIDFYPPATAARNSGQP